MKGRAPAEILGVLASGPWSVSPRVALGRDLEARQAAYRRHVGRVREELLKPGSMADLTVTPFAVVIGTASKDPEMVAMCREKAQAFINGWRSWQNQPPRVFKDTEISSDDMARYSLLLFGGPEANRVVAKLAAKLPLQVSADRIMIDGRTFSVKDAAVQMIYPHPLNAERYVRIAAGSSPDGMYFCDTATTNPPLHMWDYVITDGQPWTCARCGRARAVP